MQQKSQLSLSIHTAIVLITIFFSVSNGAVYAKIGEKPVEGSGNTTGTQTGSNVGGASGTPAPVVPVDDKDKNKNLTEKQDPVANFNAQQDAITNSQSRLGKELQSLPGPNIDFQGLLRLIITWSASIAASVAIFLVVMRSFQSISGTEESHNELKSTIIRVLIGLVLIFFSYLIVSFIMGIIWAGGSVGS
ncbi:hypothetical protein COW46_03610 [Candidatus Gracilibacteria bacterium CG17_big_fil_post_rev_8_21_14_2_50_48_13]|nr:MAG: hypothetical protein COW46_03610 [Candidatus Gracilibacteria bacterium CG17_big_fil_post_rev_8_21_14_2_50_48_13]